MRAAFEELARNHNAQTLADPGFFSWDLTEGKIYADSMVATIFGHDPLLSSNGLSVEEYMERVHPDHRSRVAYAIALTLSQNAPFHETYPVEAGNGFYQHITVIARCFRSSDGEPMNCPGIVIPHVKETSQGRDEMLWHCLSAYDLAVGAGNEHLARQMLAVLTSLRDTRNMRSSLLQ